MVSARSRRLALSLAVLLLATPARSVWAQSELRPGARLIFPYYDVRPGATTTLLLTNVGSGPTTATLTFYDRTCDRADHTVFLTKEDMAAVDLSLLFSNTGTTLFTQGFVDVVASENTLIGAATILNVTEDWAVSYHPAAAQRLSGGSPFELFPSRLALPGFFASASGPRLLDGFLVLVAPNPDISGGPIPDAAVQAQFEAFSPPAGSISLGATGHQLILPLSFFTASLPQTTAVAWLTVVNAAIDEQGRPRGLVGLFIEKVVDPAGGGGMAGAVRLWGLP